MSHQKRPTNQSDPTPQDLHTQDEVSEETQSSRAGARGVRAGGNAGARGDPVNDQSQHNYQVSRDTDLAQHADDAARRRS